jgi:radical SAM family protein/4Fe-4S single cluster protein
VTSAAESTAAGDDDSRSGFLPDRILHLHPTRLCNLACRHCYSESDPQQQDALDPVMLCNALHVLRAEGYSLISLSGGEPLVYQPLRTVIASARRLGFRITMISNGRLATRRMKPILSQLDSVAISFDGRSLHPAQRRRAAGPRRRPPSSPSDRRSSRHIARAFIGLIHARRPSRPGPRADLQAVARSRTGDRCQRFSFDQRANVRFPECPQKHQYVISLRSIGSSLWVFSRTVLIARSVVLTHTPFCKQLEP